MEISFREAKLLNKTYFAKILYPKVEAETNLKGWTMAKGADYNSDKAVIRMKRPGAFVELRASQENIHKQKELKFNGILWDETLNPLKTYLKF